MHLVYKESGTADELLPHHLFSEIRGPACRTVIEVAAIGIAGIVSRQSFVPEINIFLRLYRIILPLCAVGIAVVMVIDHILDNGYSSLMTLFDKPSVFISSACARINYHMVGIAIAPSDGAEKFHYWQ